MRLIERTIDSFRTDILSKIFKACRQFVGRFARASISSQYNIAMRAYAKWIERFDTWVMLMF